MELQYFSADFKGIFKNAKSNSVGQYLFSQIHWDYVHLDNLNKQDNIDLDKLKYGFFYFTPLLKEKRKFRKSTELFIPHGETEYFRGDLRNFLVRDFQLNDKKLPLFKNLGNGLTQIIGKAYFAIPKITPPIITPPLNPANGKGFNLFGKINLGNNSGYSSISNVNEVPSNNSGCFTQSSNVISQPIIGSSTTSGGGCFGSSIFTNNNSGCIGNIFRLIGLVYLIPSLMYLWYANPLLFWVVAILSLIWLVTRFFSVKKYFSWIGWLLFGFVAFYWYKNFKFIKTDLKHTENKKGNVKIYPPKEDGNSFKNNERDYLTAKEINWFDFFNNNYDLLYNTSSIDFLDAQKSHAKLANLTGNSNSEIYSKVYQAMINHDSRYIDSVVFKLRKLAESKKLNKLKIAEEVTTLIQEIPYCLVHDQSCKDLVNSTNSSFIREYHEEGKPCLPNIIAGVQSPYEFLHNLKGDCDTRSLLAHAILTKLGISSSVWISETYGHSILGVGLPVGSGNFKEINGVNHYAVELTAKGFRLGMISPEHRNMGNWEIALFN